MGILQLYEDQYDFFVKENLGTFGQELKEYLFKEDPAEKKELKKFISRRGTFLRDIALVQLYACGAPRKVNGN